MGWPSLIPALGAWVKIPAVEVVEVLASAGLDFIVLDQEHGAIDVRSITTLVAVAQQAELPAFVRVPEVSANAVQQALDAGADGLFIPHIDNAEAARAVVRACRFAPLGRRHGSPMTRAGRWGKLDMADFVRRANNDVTIVAQIETPQAVAAIDQIVEVEGIDAVFIGPFDLSLSSGLAEDDPAFQAMVRQVETANRGGRRLGGVAADRTTAESMSHDGYDFLMVGADVSLLGQGARAALATGGAR
ncbi:aldolase/citrate lyase family protein [Streptomyces chartreusis]|uniref:HpcH/HpaI aldolase family protein n=1 Tax=Streptomyces chartreusis TaxID=1969 RepID=UPI002F906E4D|nr:aldolase/citrate lyase family protein [Streptomyces chartreusis]WTA33524.1 aldolase/citrate lyase family protein [Streptomyces chartreusis]